MATAVARFVQSPTARGGAVARAVISDPKRHTACEPLYDVDPQTGASVEIFYADRALATSFGARAGWFWWACQRGFLPGGPPDWAICHQLCRVPQLRDALHNAAALKGLDETANAER
jgi:hypothetical protein